MLNLENIENIKTDKTDREAIEAIRSYIFQLYIELEYRLDDIDKRLKALEEKNK